MDAERGSLPYALLRGESLVAWAAWALEEAGATLVDVGTPWSALAEESLPVVLHDPLCPLTPPEFIAACVEHTLDSATVTVGVRPVTDTVKRVEGDDVGETVDRDALLQVVSPVVLPPAVVAALTGPPAGDLAGAAVELARRFPVETRTAPPAARRVAASGDVALLAAAQETSISPRSDG